MCRFGVVVLAGLGVAAPAAAASWAEALFDEVSKDFGSVPRGPTLTHPFRVSNKGQTPLHIAGVRVSCGCVSAAASQYDVAPGESAAIHVQMDTRRFVGSKHVTVYVTFDRPAWDEVRLGVQANGRDDLAVTPSSVELGKVKRGSSPTAKATVTFWGGAWRITEIQRDSNYVLAEAAEQARQGNDVRYELTVGLRPDTPVGRWYTDVWLKTNNPSLPRVRVPLSVEIESGLSVSGHATFGPVRAGEAAERRVIVRGTEPFRITDIVGADEQVRVQPGSPARKPVHVVTIKLDPKQPGDLSRTLRIMTDLKEEGAIEFPVVAQVVAPE